MSPEEESTITSKKRCEELTRPANSLLEFFKDAPLQEAELEIERKTDLPRDLSKI